VLIAVEDGEVSAWGKFSEAGSREGGRVRQAFSLVFSFPFMRLILYSP